MQTLRIASRLQFTYPANCGSLINRFLSSKLTYFRHSIISPEIELRNLNGQHFLGEPPSFLLPQRRLLNTHRSIIQQANTVNKSTTSSESDIKEVWTPVYRLPSIVVVRFISRLKLYQTGILLLATPASIILASRGEVDIGAPLVIITLSTLALAVLAAMSVFFRRLIGIVALNADKTRVRISHLTFWGNRRDVVTDLETIITPSDLGDNARKNFLVKVALYDRPDYFYLCVRYGRILDAENFHFAFGPVK